MLDTSRQLMSTGGSVNSPLIPDSHGFAEAGNENFTYEHFPVVCPTCKGQCRVADGNVNVAVIPVEDQRLKPSRLKLKMLALLAVILISGGLALIFLYPRSVTMTVLKTIPVNYSFPVQGSPFITHQTNVEINNQNFFTVSVSNFHAKVIYRQQVVGNFFQNSSKTLAIKGNQVYNTRVHAVYTQTNEKFIRQKCYKLQFQFTEELRASALISYWYHAERISVTKYIVIDCKHMTFPLFPVDPEHNRGPAPKGVTHGKNISDSSGHKSRQSSYLRHLNRRYKLPL